MPWRAPGTNFTINGRPLSPSNKEIRVILFILHYGFVWTVHGALVYLYFGMSSSDLFGSFEPLGVAIAATALFLSHGVSFLVDFLGKEEYLTDSPARQMTEPYSRVLVLTVTILWGGFSSTASERLWPRSSCWCCSRRAIDLLTHLREHCKAGMRSYPRPEQLLRGG